MTGLTVKSLCVEARNTQLVEAASFGLNPGELVAIVGPNGAGKTSLLRGALGLVPATGTCLIGDEQIGTLAPHERALLVSYLPQIRPLAWPNLVRDVVALGRFAHGAAMGQLSAMDAEAVNRALEACDISHLADRAADTLSGGEMARMHFARAFAAETPLLIADEPVAALDPRHQLRIMDLIKSYVEQGGGALVVLHDLNLAVRYADRLVWMMEGNIIADGSPSETLTAERMADVFGVEAAVSEGRIEILGAL